MTANYLKLIDTQTGGPRYDVTPLFKHVEAFEELIRDLAQPFLGRSIDLVAGIDALGFILGTGLALYLHKGFIPIRKGGKLPGKMYQITFVDYSHQEKSLEMREDAIDPGKNVLLVDEWVETGAQIAAAAQLIEDHGGIIAGIAAINMDNNRNTQALREQYFCNVLTANL
jgi:adenine phosphoribosyltransferase